MLLVPVLLDTNNVSRLRDIASFLEIFAKAPPTTRRPSSKSPHPPWQDTICPAGFHFHTVRVSRSCIQSVSASSEERREYASKTTPGGTTLCLDSSQLLPARLAVMYSEHKRVFRGAARACEQSDPRRSKTVRVSRSCILSSVSEYSEERREHESKATPGGTEL